MKRNLILMLIVLLMTGNITYAGSNTTFPVDVSRTHWVYDSVKTAAADGWLVLNGGNAFRPEDRATRASVAQLLVEAWSMADKAGRASRTLPEASNGSTAFIDMDTATPDEQAALKRLANAGILAGYPGGLIKPEAPITRLEMAVVLAGACKGEGHLTLNYWDQNQIPQWGKTAVKRSTSLGLISGYPDGSFGPLQPVTNAEALQMIGRWVYPNKAVPVVSRNESAFAEDPVAADILRLINAERARFGLNPLRVDPTLRQIAISKSSAMANGSYFSHISPGGESTKDLFARYGLNNVDGAENLLRLRGSFTAEKAVAAWMQSGAHRQFILTPYTDTGIGFARGADGTVYIAETFASL